MKILTGIAYTKALYAARARGGEKAFRAEQTAVRISDPVWAAAIEARAEPLDCR